MAPCDLTALPWSEARELLRGSGLACETLATRPARPRFPLDGSRLHVVRQRRNPDGTVSVTLAARQALRG